MANDKNTSGHEIKAAVVREKGAPFKIETLTLEEARRDEVLVKIVASGMCHTDVVARDKVYDVPHPIVLGHEGGATLEDVQLMYKAVDGRCLVEAAGGIREIQEVLQFLQAGARRFGSTRTEQFVQGFQGLPEERRMLFMPYLPNAH